MKVVKSCS